MRGWGGGHFWHLSNIRQCQKWSNICEKKNPIDKSGRCKWPGKANQIQINIIVTREIILLKHAGRSSARAAGSSPRQASALSKTFFSPRHWIFLGMFSSFEAEKQGKVDSFLSLFIFQRHSLMCFSHRAAAFPAVPLTFSAGFLASCLHHSAATATPLRASELGAASRPEQSMWERNKDCCVQRTHVANLLFQRQSHNCDVKWQQMQLFHLDSITSVSKRACDAALMLKSKRNFEIAGPEPERTVHCAPFDDAHSRLKKS